MSSSYRHLTILLVLAALFVALPVHRAYAGSVLDQSQETASGYSPIFNNAILAQTFTPSITGQLDHVDLRTWNAYGNPTGPGIVTNVSIVETADAGRPTGTVLAVVQVPQFVLGWNSVDFSAEAIALNAGTQYGIVMANTDPSYLTPPTDTFLVQWDDNHYPGGILWEWLPATGWAPARFNAASLPEVADATFRTFMASDPSEPYDPSGQYWYGWLGIEDNSMPMTSFGQMDAPATPGPWNLSYYSSDGSSELEVINVTSASFIPHGWLALQGSIGADPWNEIVAANGHFIQDVARGAEENPDTSILIRKDFYLTDSDVVGTYTMYGHWLDTASSSATAETATVICNSDHTFSLSSVDSDGNPGSASGTWVVDVGNSRLLLDVDGEGEKIVPVGQGGLMMDFDLDPDDDVGYDFLVKQTTGRTIAEAEGQFLFQSFSTDEFGIAFTQWGILDIQANGNWSLDATDSSGGSTLVTGTATMDDDGTIHAVEDGSGRTHDMVISLDSDLIVGADMGEDDTLGLNFLVRAVPEPTTLALLALALIPALRRTRKESYSH